MAQVSRLANASVLPQRCPLAQAVAFSLALSGSAHAATFNVTTAADSGAGSLRDAVAQANSAAGADVITFNNGLGTITLTSGQIDITETLTITGPAAGQTISGNNSSRIFAVTAVSQPLTLENLTLMDGATTATSPFPARCATDTGEGGAVCTLSPLTLTNSTISGNVTIEEGAHGGALFVNADATLTNSTISGNSTAGDRARGGALFVYGKATLNNSTISGNSTTGDNAHGGGVFVDGDATLIDSIVSGNSTIGDNAYGGGFTVFGVTTLTNSTVSNNSTTGYAAHGGGLHVAGESMLSNSTVSGNRTAGASALGGGLYMAGPATLTNSTISGNSTAGINAHGGGLFMNGRITISNSTIAGNSTADADADGGGLFAIGFNRTATLSNTILAANTGAGGNFVAVLTTLNASYSLLGDDASEINGTNSNNIFNDAPGLAALADNGCTQPAGASGSAACVQTQALQAGSPALDAADSAVCTADLVNGLDQRGSIRGFNATGTPDNPAPGDCDIGAYEWSADTLTIIKQTLPDGSATAFTFSGALAGAISDGEQLSAELLPGQYSVSETVPAGWDLIDISCDNDAVTTDLNMASIALTLNGTGSATTCTFTNSQRGQIEIRKETQPAGAPESFNFSGDLGDFTLQDGDSNIRMDLPASRTYVIQEADPAPDFDLTTIACYESINLNSTHTLTTRTATVALDPGELVICTFTNRQRAQLNIRVDGVGPDFNTTFGFTTSGGLSPSNFSLHDGETQSFSGLIPDQTYTVNEQVPANWVLEEILCSEPPPVCETGSIIVTPEPGQSIDATFRFRLGLSGEPTSPQTIPALSLWGLGGLISLLGLVLGWRWRRG